MTTFSLKTHAFREFPGPQNSPVEGAKVKHYVLLCRADSLPAGIPLDPNPRGQNIDRMIYKEVRKSLERREEPSFHLKNKGITILADDVKQNNHMAEIRLSSDQHGIVDGGHTYKIIQESIKEREIPDNQYVKVEILTGLPDEYISEIAGGLNTALQVSEVSLETLRGNFKWIEEALEGEAYFEKIIYREGDKGDISVRDLIAFIHMFIPQKNGAQKKEHPKLGYTQKAQCLKHFQKNMEDYKAMRPILKDILQLHDYILDNARAKYNQETGGNAGALSFMHKKKKGRHHLLFMQKNVEFLMHDGALYPILGAFRYLVGKDINTQTICWKLGDFENVKKFCGSILGSMVKSTKDVAEVRARNVNAVGKDDTHWENLYKTVALAYLQKQE